VRLGSLTRAELIFTDLSALDRAGILRELAARLAGLGLVADGEELAQRLLERESLGSTGIGGGIAIPHCKIDDLTQGILALAVAPRGVDFGAADGKPVQLFFLLISPSASPAQHLQVLATISRWVRAGGSVGQVAGLSTSDEIFDLLQRSEV
jgi:mannitol/fructose-specific phosphotransferase system IIA component (Ntr-type)